MKKEIPDVPDYEAIKPRAVLMIEVGGKRFYASFEGNPAASAFTEKLNSGALTVDVCDRGGLEKTGPLPYNLPQSDKEITTTPGDVILYNENRIALCCGEAEKNCTRLARIGNVTKEKLLEALGTGGAQVTFSLEWSE